MPALRPAAQAKPLDEKITVNLGFVDLGQIDLLVQEGFYANRSDLIRTAIRNQITSHADVVKQAVGRRTLVLGIQHLSAAELEAVRARGEALDMRVLGLLSIAADVTPELARQTLRSLVVLGSLHASPTVKAALADRMTP
jgi:Arc/MetJ-type ribon-helix-helix transcriptional regulator